MEVCSRLQGAYALLIKSARYPNELVACKQGSPLVYGLKRGGGTKAAGVELWLSSDSAALLSHTRDIVVGALFIGCLKKGGETALSRLCSAKAFPSCC
jgi:glucosamine--fructose-6-phosphate aminotransferase (isomerizing)